MPRIHSTDGTELFYLDWGAGNPVVFIHGLQMSSDMWKYQMMHLVEHGFRAIALDRRGHGRSDDPGTGYDYDTLADDLAALLDQLDLADATLVGHSMGGSEIVHYLSRRGDARVSRIVLLSSTLPKLEAEPQVKTAVLHELSTNYGEWIQENAALSFGDGLPGCAIPQVDRERTIRDWMGSSLQAVVACTDANLSADFRAELTEINVPVLVLHGDHDVFAPLATCARRAAELLTDSQLVVYRDAAHMPQLSHRRRLNSDLLSFARSPLRGH